MKFSDIELTNASNMNEYLDCFMNKIFIHEFKYNYNIIELGCLKEIIGIYLEKKTTAVYKSKNEKNRYYTYFINKIEETNIHILNNLNEDQKNALKKYCSIFIEIDIKKLEKIKFKILLKKTITAFEFKKYKSNIISAGEKIIKDIKEIIDSIKNRESSIRGLVKYEGIKTKEITGYYYSKYFEIDAGEECKVYSTSRKKIKIKYKFEEYFISTKFDVKKHRVEFLNLLSNMYSELFQTIINTPFINSTNLKYYGENDNLSSFNTNIKYIDKNDTDSKKYVHIPKQIDSIMNNYLKFDAIKQNVFYRSCKSLNNALKTDGVKSLFYSYQAIENIAAYYEKIGVFSNSNRSDNIKALLIKYYNSSFPNEAHKFWDEYRNKYAHNGIEENELIEMAINEEFDSFRIIQSDELFANIVRTIILNILKEE